MGNLLSGMFNKEETTQEIIDTPKSAKTLEEAEKIIYNKVFERNETSPEMMILVNEATAGDEEARRKFTEIIIETLKSSKVEVEGYTIEQLAYRIFANKWGLEGLQELYDDPEVSEIRVNNKLQAFVKRMGKNEATKVHLNNNKQLGNLISRLIQHDFGVTLNKSNPIAESMRRDNTRITALSYPVVGGTENDPGYTLVLRKHNTFKVTPAALEQSGTMSRRVWEAIRLLYRGGMNLVFSGNTGSGKTSDLRAMVETLPQNTRIVTIESDRELYLEKYYPNMDLTSLEEHDQLNATMDRLFEIVLRLSPDVIIVGEFRGKGEVNVAIDACTRGHKRAMATAHFNSPTEVLDGIAMLMVRETASINFDNARILTAKAFDLIVQLQSNSVAGKIKLDSVSQMLLKDGKPTIIPLIQWKPFTTDYMGDGTWEFVNLPDDEYIDDQLFKNGVSREDLKMLWDM